MKNVRLSKKMSVGFLAALLALVMCSVILPAVALAEDRPVVKDVEITIVQPKCGTVVTGDSWYDMTIGPEAAYGRAAIRRAPGDDYKQQTPQPEVTLPSGVSYYLAGNKHMNYGLWYDPAKYDAPDFEENPAFQGTMKGGKTYYAEISLTTFDPSTDTPISLDTPSSEASYFAPTDELNITVNGAKLKESWGEGPWLGLLVEVEAVHVPQETKKNVVKPTCTKDGSHDEVTLCSKCGEVLGTKKVTEKAIGHDWGAWKVTKKATYTAAGKKQRVCKNDPSHVQTKRIPKKKITGAFVAKLTAKGADCLKLTWSKVKGAKGYDIFFSPCSSPEKKQTPKKVMTIKGNKVFSWSKSGLESMVPHKAVVKAWVKKNGKKKYVKSSPIVHAYTSGENSESTNPKSVKVKKRKTLTAGTSFKLKAYVTKVNPDKKLIPSGHAKKLRYVSSNKKVATVDAEGKVTAVAAGKCKIYAVAVNGVSKACKITVK